MNVGKLPNINVKLFQNRGVISNLLMGAGVWYAHSRHKPGQVAIAVVMPSAYVGYHVMKNIDNGNLRAFYEANKK